MPKTYRFHEPGGPEKLQLEELSTRPVEAGEVRLRVEAMGLNRAELMYLGGYYLESPVLPSRIGYEVVGVVSEVGAGVDAGLVGKRMATVPGFSMNQFGSLGEEAVVPAWRLVASPAKLSTVEATAIWMQYLTAYGALVWHGKVGNGDFVLITAASSSVGLAAIQIAKAEGAVAIATTRRSDKREALLAEGADYVIATEEEDLEARVKEITGGKLARIVFDPVAGPFVDTLAKVTAQGGTIFEYGALSLEPTPFPLMLSLLKAIRVQGYTLHEITADEAVFAEAKRYVTDGIDRGLFHPKIAKVFPFAQAREAYEYLASNAQIGKVVITIP